MNWMLCFLAVASLLLLGSHTVAAQDNEYDLPLTPAETLLDRVLQEHPAENFANCADSSLVVLNEICSVGTECDRDVRIADFIELYNPGSRPVDLSCFVLSTRDRKPFVPNGMLDSRELKAFGEQELGFRISKKKDFVVLHLIERDAEGALTAIQLERIEIAGSHALRWPDGGRWYAFTVKRAETGWPGSYGKSNELPADEPPPNELPLSEPPPDEASQADDPLDEDSLDELPPDMQNSEIDEGALGDE